MPGARSDSACWDEACTSVMTGQLRESRTLKSEAGFQERKLFELFTIGDLDVLYQSRDDLYTSALYQSAGMIWKHIGEL